MFTVSYRGWFIHGKFNTNTLSVQNLDYSVHFTCVSLRGAKERIRKLVGA